MSHYSNNFMIFTLKVRKKKRLRSLPGLQIREVGGMGGDNENNLKMIFLISQ